LKAVEKKTNHPMKITPKVSKGGKSKNAEYGKCCGFGLQKVSGRRRAVAPKDGGETLQAEGGEDSLRIYLNEIGGTPLLSKQQEADLGRSIREAFEALLQHMLGSGYILEVLLDRVESELGGKGATGQRGAALQTALGAGRSVLLRARNCVAAGFSVSPTLRNELKRVFSGLVAALDVWPGIGVELLELLASRHALSDLSLGVTAGMEDSFPQDEFAVANLMGHSACRLFIREGQRLKNAALLRRNQMVDANLRLVVSLAAKMKHAYLSRQDLIQEGNFGLVTAAERFDERLGNRFSTFAVNLIKAAMRRENDNQGRTIRLPVHQCEALRRLEQARVNLEHQLRRAPSPLELAEETGFKRDQILELFVLREGPVSIHGLAGGEGDATLEDLVADPDSLKPFYGESELSGSFDAQLRTLEEGQRRVISYSYGLGGFPQLSPAETAVLLGIPATEVKRLHKRALQAIRAVLLAEAGPYACAA